MTFDQWLDKPRIARSGPTRRTYYSDNQLTAARDAWEAATAAEREECAVMCDEDDIPYLAAAIRSRGAK